jgi:hypothetical protein
MFVLLVCFLISQHLLPFLLVPAILASIRVVGEVMQQKDLGPVWAQHHLGDVGIIANNMTWGLIATVVITASKDRDKLAELYAQPQGSFWSCFRPLGVVLGPRIPAAFFCVSLLIYVLAMLADVQTAFFLDTPEGEEPRYSGKFDWIDAIAYTIGMTAMTLNYFFVGRKVRQKILLQPAK